MTAIILFNLDLSSLTDLMLQQNSLPRASSFVIENSLNLQSITIEKGVLQSLTSLDLVNFPRLEIVNIPDATFPDLKSIRVTSDS